MRNEILRGIPASPSIAVAEALIYSSKEAILSPSREVGSVEDEISLFERVRNKSLKQLRKLKNELKKDGQSESTRLLDVQILFLQDPLFLNNVEKRIRESGESAEEAIINFADSLEEDFKNIPNSYISERYLDVQDVMERLLKNISEKSRDLIMEGVDKVVVAKSLNSSELLQMSREGIKGIVVEVGGKTSHIAILAEALNIPAVVGLDGVTSKIEEGDTVIVDGMSGTVIVNPDETARRRFERKKTETDSIQKEFMEKKDLPSVTIDGYSVDISANIELPVEISSIKKYGAKGVGLLRTEFLYLTSEEIPDEETQYNFYSEVAEVCSPDYVIIRTLDLGGDKVFKQQEREANPFLGWRGVRFTLEMKEIFRIQLRAILRASSVGNVHVLVPMVSQVSEMEKVMEIIDEIKGELKSEGYDFDENIEVGAMVEIPSVPLLADKFSEVVDFFSIGTNDLTQYTLAVDRGNKKVSELFDQLDPSIISLMKMTVEEAHHRDKWVGVCGDIATDIVAIPVLIGMEVDELSLPPPFIPQIKNVIRGIGLKESRELLQKVEKKSSAGEVRKFLRKELLDRIPVLKNILVEVENDSDN